MLICLGSKVVTTVDAVAVVIVIFIVVIQWFDAVVSSNLIKNGNPCATIAAQSAKNCFDNNMENLNSARLDLIKGKEIQQKQTVQTRAVSAIATHR